MRAAAAPSVDRSRAATGGPATPHWTRRARLLLGTLVEVGTHAGDEPGGADAETLVEAAFAAVVEAQRRLSRFDAASDIAAFNALPAGQSLRVHAPTRTVLRAAAALRDATAGLFDITLGSGTHDWALKGDRLRKTGAAVRFDLGGIGKGHAVDAAIAALRHGGAAGGWVNAGGDLRCFGDAEIRIELRDEQHGGVRGFAALAEGAFATSHFGAASRCALYGRGVLEGHRRLQARGAAGVHDALGSRGAFDKERVGRVMSHASVAAPSCLWADALTKVVAASGDASHPVLARHGARAWVHPAKDGASATPANRDARLVSNAT